MNSAFFFVIPDASFASILATDNQIQGYVSMSGSTYYITGNPTPPGGTTYACRMNANGTFIRSQARQPALTPVHTFFGWNIPA